MVTGREAIKNQPRPSRVGQSGALMVEMLVAMAILAGVLLPLAYSFTSERRYIRAAYQRALAMEIVDGEMEVLLAGQWRAFTPGVHPYTVGAEAATNLPPGQFTLTLEAAKVRLQWQPALKDHGGPVIREARIK